MSAELRFRSLGNNRSAFSIIGVSATPTLRNRRRRSAGVATWRARCRSVPPSITGYNVRLGLGRPVDTHGSSRRETCAPKAATSRPASRSSDHRRGRADVHNAVVLFDGDRTRRASPLPAGIRPQKRRSSVSSAPLPCPSDKRHQPIDNAASSTRRLSAAGWDRFSNRPSAAGFRPVSLAEPQAQTRQTLACCGQVHLLWHGTV
jgi:hypothetical protein